MSNTVRGISAAAARRAAWAVVMPTLFYGVDVWYPGAERVPKGHLAIIQKTLTAACRMILPSWKTTPKTTLWKEAGIPPAELLLEQIAARNANRWARLDTYHPLVRRLLQQEHEIQYATNPNAVTARRTAMKGVRLFRNAALAPAMERPRLIPQRFSDAIWTESKGSRPTKERQIERIQAWSKTQTGLVVYSDGSKTERDMAGWGYAVYRQQRLIAQGRGQIDKGEVFDAEIRGALEGLRTAIAQRRRKEKITVCIDKTSVIDCIGTTAPPSSQMAFRTFQKTGDANPGMIRVRWCPDHAGIEGNELADQLAKEGAKMPVGENPPTVSYSKRHMRSLLAIAFQRWWDAVDRESYHGLQLKAELKKLPELTLQRRQLGYLLAARTHHGDFADYHERFKHEDADLNCPCGRRKSPTHLFYCRKIPRSLRPRLTPEPETAIRRYLGRSFQTYVKLADFYYAKINKRY
ncbi:hypothetical protein ARSEF4850_010159 [Beauveria asiatica]